MNTIIVNFLLFWGVYFIIGASLSLFPIYEAWLEKLTQKALRTEPFADKYVVRCIAYGLFVLLWAVFWSVPLPLTSKKRK